MAQGTDRTAATADFSTAPPLFSPLPVASTPRRGAILIVEDRDDVRHGLAQLLELHGYVVFEAANANDAFAHFDSSPGGIALILLDLILPGPGGAEIRETQLADPKLSNIPIVVVSSCAPDMDGGADLRAAAWLEKPFRFDQLLEEVKRFVVAEAPTTSDRSQESGVRSQRSGFRSQESGVRIQDSDFRSSTPNPLPDA